MDIKTIKDHVDKQTKDFEGRFKTPPNVLLINEEIYGIMQTDAKELLKKYSPRKMDEQELQRSVNNITNYQGLKIIIVKGSKQAALGYIEFRDIPEQIPDAEFKKEPEPAKQEETPDVQSKIE